MTTINRRTLVRLFAAAVIVAVAVATNILDTPIEAQKSEYNVASFAGSISGQVFQDFNGNGAFDSTSTIANNGFGNIGVAVDRGVQNVEVRAYDAAGANVTTGGVVLSDSSGNYTLVTSDASSGPYRLEFSALPAGFFPSARSTDSVNGGTATNSGSTVQYVSTPATGVNLAVNHPSDYSQNNPEVAVSIYVSGNQITGVNNGIPVLSTFPYSAGSTDTSTTANVTLYDSPAANPMDVAANQAGPVYGLAYARRTRLLYAGAYFKRHVGFGPQGPNALYVIDRAGLGSVTGFYTVPGTATNSHDTANYPRDNNNTGWNAVGKTSLGGVAISEDESTLYVVNLSNRTLYSLNASTGAQIASQAVPTNLPLPSGTCPAADARPFATQMYRGQLYVGLVCSAESSANVDTFTDSNGNGVHDSGDYYIDANLNGVRNTGESYLELTGNGAYNAGETFTDGDGNGVYNLGDARNLRAYVYAVNPTTLAFGASPVFQMPLNYRRGVNTATQGANGAWRPWSNVYRNASTNSTRTVYSQPMLTDISFDNGNLVLGLRDRVGDQVGNGALSDPGNASNTTFYQPRTAGDVIKACGVIGSWSVENNGRCGGTGAAPQNVAEGPGGAEFYFGDAFSLSGTFLSPAVTIEGKGSNHYDTGSGGLAQLPGAPDVMITNFDAVANIPGTLHDGGIRWLSNNTGAFTKGYRLYDGDGDDPDFLGKAGGVGSSLEILSDPAPIEIGNRVWRDSNSNGVQDPGEPAVAGVTVRLYRAGTLVGTAVTDANGEYYFVSSTTADGNTGDNIGQVNGGIQFTTAYQVRFDNPVNYQFGGPLFGYTATAVNQTSQLGNDDSSDSDAIPILNPTGSPAGNFPVIFVTTGNPGQNDHTFDVGFRLAPAAASVTVTGRVATASGRAIRGASVTLTDSNGNVRVAISSTFGYYRFTDVPAGQLIVLQAISTKRYTFEGPSVTISADDDLEVADFIANEN
jgi:hypothetical protein